MYTTTSGYHCIILKGDVQQKKFHVNAVTEFHYKQLLATYGYVANFVDENNYIIIS